MHGAEVLTASSAEEALGLLRETEPMVVVSDIGMPSIDGYEFMRRLRNSSLPRAQIPALALTAFARAEDRDRALAAGFQLYASKPIEPAELVALVETLARAPS
jgi:CheY-like chemotaxis protein